MLFNKKIFLLFFIFFSFQGSSVWAADIFVLQSARFPVYNDALQGFETVLLRDIPVRGLKSILPHTITTHILSEESDPRNLQQEIIRKHPDLIVCIGSSSLSLVRGITATPIIYLLVPNPESIINSPENVTGISMNLTAEQQLDSLIRMLPKIKSIGLLYDPAKTGELVEEAENYTQKNNIKFIALSVKSSREVPGQLARLKGEIDCYWMMPDQTVITPETLGHIFLFSLENRVPIFTFAEKYLKLGAVLSVSFDANDMGKQAGELALGILNNTREPALPPVPARKVNVRVNQMAAKTLGIDLKE